MENSQEENKENTKIKCTLFIKPMVILFLILGIVSVPLIYLYLKYPTASPIFSAKLISSELNYNHLSLSKKVIGFMPYWLLSQKDYIRFDHLSEIIYFSLTLDSDGNFVKVVDSQTDPGWRWWNSSTLQDLIAKTQILKDKFSLSLAMQDNQTIETFLNTPSSWDNLIKNTENLVQTRHLDGINLDFEYSGKADSKLRDEFSLFAQHFVKSIKVKDPNLILSIDTYPLAVRESKLPNISGIKDLFDEYIVMSYDYYQPSSDTAGPGSPISGFANNRFFFDITTTYNDYSKIIPPDKIIMGVPYYGWDWPVVDGSTPLSQVLPQNDSNGYAAVISYGRMRSDKDLKPSQCFWDEDAQQPWCWYTDPSTQIDHQTWFEDNRSISAKFDFANSHNLAGVSIWSLGYDRNYTDLWNLIEQKFTK